LAGDDLYAVYSDRVAHCYSDVSKRAVGNAAALVVDQGRRLQRLLKDQPRQRIDEYTKNRLNRRTDSPEALTQTIAAMQETIRDAIADECTAAERYEAAAARYDTIAEAIDHHATKHSFDHETVSRPIQQYTRGVQTRLLEQIGRLIDNRFDSALFRQILVSEVLAQQALAEHLQGMLDLESRRLEASWHKEAQSHAIPWTEPPLDCSVAIAEPVEGFLKPIQLHYERPSAIRSVFMGLGRGKLEDKLIREVNEGVANLTQSIVQLLEHAWQDMADHYRNRAVQALQTWMQAATGHDRALSATGGGDKK
jgi:hypothetical protein